MIFDLKTFSLITRLKYSNCNHASWKVLQLLWSFFKLLGFPDLFGKVFLINFKFSLLDFSSNGFSREQCKQNKLINSVTIQRYYNGRNIIKIIDNNLVLTSSYFPVQEIWCCDSWKLISVNQSRFYNCLLLEEFKKVQHNFKRF